MLNSDNLNVELLISTMHQHDHSLLDRMQVNSDAVVVNQCDRNSIGEFNYNGYSIKWINSKERGLSNSRNMALKNARGDIVLLCDDDEVLYDGYADNISNSYKEVSDADLIVFNINRIGWNEEEKRFSSIKRIPFFKTYSSVHISFRRKQVINNSIMFDMHFGAGSGLYSSAEDAIFCVECHRAGLKMYTYPLTIGQVTCESSSWFHGYDERYFYDTGAFLARAYPKTKYLMMVYYPVRCRRISSLSTGKILSSIIRGIRGYKKLLSYDDFCDFRKKQ